MAAIPGRCGGKMPLEPQETQNILTARKKGAVEPEGTG